MNGKQLTVLTGVVAMFVFAGFCATVLWIQADDTHLDRSSTALAGLFLVPLITAGLVLFIQHNWKDTPPQ